MKTVENLLNANGNKKLGNHRKEVGEGFKDTYITGLVFAR